jgi:hypothetical protein
LRANTFLILCELALICRIRTTFPDSNVNTIGMFYNGRTSRVDVSVSNKEAKPIVVHLIGGAFQDVATLKPVHNVHILLPLPPLSRLGYCC